MVDIQELLYVGSVTISMNEDGKLIGSTLIEMENGYFPLSLKDEQLKFLKLHNGIMSKLRAGNCLYIIDGHFYMGKSVNVGPYGEDSFFLSDNDVEDSNFFELEKQINEGIVKKKRLVKTGEFYRE